MNYVISIVLFIVTMLVMYMAWYIISGRRRKKGEPDNTQKERKDSGKKQKWGVDKDAYCYPKINDVMGFEFVKVVNVPDELIGGSVKEQKQDANAKKSWSESKGIGGLVASSENGTPEEMDEDTVYPDTSKERQAFPKRRLKPVDHQKTFNTGNEKPEDMQDDEPDIDVSGEELDEVEGITWGEWTDRENSGSIPSDEELNRMIDENESMIQVPEMSDEQMKTSEDIEQMKERFFNSDENSNNKKLNFLLSDNDDEPDLEPTETVDFDTGENDYPDTEGMEEDF